jgi:outer membrane receptor protein involved in Fe transport
MRRKSTGTLCPAARKLIAFPRIAAVFVLVIAPMLMASTVFADSAKTAINIPPQELSTALKALASRANVQILFATDALKGTRTTGVSGDYTAEEALQRLLAGTPYYYRTMSANTFTIQMKAEKKSETTAARLPEVVVTATKTEREITDVPANVSVITARDLKRQQLVKVEDALKNVEGIDFNTSPANGGASVPLIRGIGGSFAGSTSVVLVDGMATDSYISSVIGRGGFNFLAPQDIDRIEVVRGPASALYGPNVVGGVVNVIQKRWSGKPGAEFIAEAGSHDSRTLGAVIGMADDRIDIRLSAYDFSTDGFVAKPDPDPWGDKDAGPRSWKDRKLNLSGAVRLSNDQEIGLTVQQFRTDQDYYGGSSFRNSQKLEGDAYTLAYRKEFSDRNLLRLNYRHANLLQSWIDSPDGMGVGQRKSITDTVEAQIDLRLFEHNTLTFGASYQSADFETVSNDPFSLSTSEAESTGVFVQDEHRFGNFILVAGGRYDYIDQGGSMKNGTALNQGASQHSFNPRVGLRYHFSPATSFYASAGTAFVPASANLKYPGNPARWRDNPGLKPESSTTYEIGVNQKLSGVALRAAIYHTDYEDRISSVSVGATPWPRQYVNIGRVEVNGVELGLDGDLSGGWKPYANYAYTDSKIRENPSDPLTVGKRVQRIAPHKLNLGVVYAPNKTWDARISGRYVSERFFTDRNTPDHRAPGYFVADAKISAKLPVSSGMGQWEAFVAVNNLFDKRYTEWEYEFSDGRNYWLGASGRF